MLMRLAKPCWAVPARSVCSSRLDPVTSPSSPLLLVLSSVSLYYHALTIQPQPLFVFLERHCFHSSVPARSEDETLMSPTRFRAAWADLKMILSSSWWTFLIVQAESLKPHRHPDIYNSTLQSPSALWCTWATFSVLILVLNPATWLFQHQLFWFSSHQPHFQDRATGLTAPDYRMTKLAARVIYLFIIYLLLFI